MPRKDDTKSPKERGCWLTGFLVLMVIHSIVTGLLLYYFKSQNYDDAPTWLGVLFILALAKIVAAIAIWYWQRWGLILYGIAVIISIIVGLVVTGTQLWVFHEILPLAILGWIIKDKWADFGMGTD